MSDKLTPVQRHVCMSHIHGKDTKPELKVRKWLWSHGYRYRLNVKGVPGKPDIVMRKYKTSIFVNGCFWHGHEVKWKTENGKLKVGNAMTASPAETCHGASIQIEDSICCRIPKTNRDFWVNKIRRNQERDQRNYKLLQDNGWQVIVVWECQLKSAEMEHTMRQVEVQLHDYYLKTFDHRSASYIHVEEDLPIAAENEIMYDV